MGRRLALLIATYEYQDPGLRQLTAPAHDAEALAAVLADPAIAGFEVTTLINQPQRRVGQAIGEFYRDRRRDDLTLLYFTGHGLKDEDGRLYLAMTDTLIDNLLFTGLSAEQVDQAVERCMSRLKVLVLDCCYSGAYPAGLRTKGDTAVHSLERFRGRGRTVLTASDATQYSFEGNEPHGEATQSVFTCYLVEGLRDGGADLDRDGDITLDELYGYVHDRVVAEMPQQRPRKQDDVEGRLVIARNINWTLPAYLRNAIGSPIAGDRAAALEGLAHLHRIGNSLVREQVLDQIHLLAEDDSKAVSAAATKLRSSLTSEPEAVEPVTIPEPVPLPPQPPPTPVATAPRSRLPRSSLIGGVLGLAAGLLVTGGGTGGMGSVTRVLTASCITALVAAACVLARRTRTSIGPGLLLGVALAAIWGGVAFGLDLPRFPWHYNVLLFTPAGFAVLYVATSVVILPMFARGEIRLRRTSDSLPWLQVGLVTAVSWGEAAALTVVHLDNQLFRSSFLVAAVLAAVVPAVVAVLTPRRFALSVLVGWAVWQWVVFTAASADVTYTGAVYAGVSTAAILWLGVAVAALTLVCAVLVLLAARRHDMSLRSRPAVYGAVIALLVVVLAPGVYGYISYVDRSGLVLVHESKVIGVKYSPDGTTLSTVTGDGHVRRWDLTTGKTIIDFETDTNARYSFNGDGTKVAVAGWSQKSVRVWDVRSGQSSPSMTTEREIQAVALSPDGNTVAAAVAFQGTWLWNARTGERSGTLPDPHDLSDIEFSPDGKTLAAVGHLADLRIRLWNLDTGQSSGTISPDNDEAFAWMVFSPDSKTLATTNDPRSSKAQVWDIGTGKAKATFIDWTTGILAFSPDGKHVVTGSNNSASDDNQAQLRDFTQSPVWDPVTATFTGHIGPVRCADVSRDGKTVATGSYDHTVRLWNTETGQPVKIGR